MATVRASCPTCEAVELTTKDLTVQVCADTAQGTYSFVCPLCGLAVSRATDEQVIGLLVSAGVPMQVWTLPAELRETHAGAPFTWDDVLVFHDLLETPDWFDELLRQTAR